MQCRGSGERLPIPSGCEESEAVFLERMGLEWRDVVALMGAHTLGRGDRDVSLLCGSRCFICLISFASLDNIANPIVLCQSSRVIMDVGQTVIKMHR